MDVKKNALPEGEGVPDLGVGWRAALMGGKGAPVFEGHSISAIDDDNDERTLLQHAQAGGIGRHAVDMRKAPLITHQRRQTELLEPIAYGRTKIAKVVARRTDENLKGVTHGNDVMRISVLLKRVTGANRPAGDLSVGARGRATDMKGPKAIETPIKSAV
jgi:hypothetical protein